MREREHGCDPLLGRRRKVEAFSGAAIGTIMPVA
jgi:hypothetical protein